MGYLDNYVDFMKYEYDLDFSFYNNCHCVRVIPKGISLDYLFYGDDFNDKTSDEDIIFDFILDIEDKKIKTVLVETNNLPEPSVFYEVELTPEEIEMFQNLLEEELLKEDTIKEIELD